VIFTLFFMAQQNQIQMPGAFGGIMRYDSEYQSKFMISPRAVIAFLVAVIAFVVVLKVFWPIA
jgi:preprotein translocase subunit Sec61beta